MALLKEINIDEEKLLEIDNALKSIGCTFINDIDAKDKYPEIKAIVPGGTSVNWIERRISITHIMGNCIIFKK
jgi:metal-sulfur cluster biosynthetic enzyme